MRTAWLVAVTAALVLGGTSGAAGADEVSIDQVPPAVRATIERETRGGRIKEIERQTKNGRVVYEVEFVQGDKEYEIHVALDGTLLKRKEDGLRSGGHVGAPHVVNARRTSSASPAAS